MSIGKEEPKQYEMNQNYKILAEMVCNEDAIVLAYNEKAPQPYVTWRTTKDRHRGFDVGVYFSEFKSAFKNYEQRSHDMVENNLMIQKQKIRPRSKNQER